MNIKTLVLASFALLILFGSGVKAQDKPRETYDSVSEIPTQLSSKLVSLRYREQYIYQNLSIIRQNARDNKILTSEDIRSLADEVEDKQRRRQMSSLIRFDENLDGRVTREEVVKAHTMSSSNKIRVTKKIEETMSFDSNGDGVITVAEMYILKDKKSSKVSAGQAYLLLTGPAGFLKLDPNGDGKLTSNELKHLAEKAFDTVDTNLDGILSKEELEVLVPKGSIKFQPRACKLPRLDVSQKIVFLGVESGNAVSTVSLSGQTHKTSLVQVKIDEGAEKLYFITSSKYPVIWKFTGHTERIENLVLLGPSYGKEGHVRVGAVGIPKEKVETRVSSKCRISFGYDKEKQESTSKTLRQLLGRAPDFLHVIDNPTGFRVFQDGISTDISKEMEEAQKQAPKGFDKALWERHIQFTAGGLVPLNPEDVVSIVKPEVYKVLPKWAGIARLVKEGAIVLEEKGGKTIVVNRYGEPPITVKNIAHIMNDNMTSLKPKITFEGVEAYKIIKNIPYYPPGLHGWPEVKFIIGKGITLPEGDMGQAIVVLEETGERVMKNNIRLGYSGKSNANSKEEK